VERARERLATPVACAAKNADGDLPGGAVDREFVTCVAAADKRYESSETAGELERDGERGA
jgi:hypothetical protein